MEEEFICEEAEIFTLTERNFSPRKFAQFFRPVPHNNKKVKQRTKEENFLHKFNLVLATNFLIYRVVVLVRFLSPSLSLILLLTKLMGYKRSTDIV
jgi:hypothetical protein